MCCHHRRPKEANLFHEFSSAFGKGSTAIFNIKFVVGKQFFEKELTKTKETAINAES
jgi:hypothetical protein